MQNPPIPVADAPPFSTEGLRGDYLAADADYVVAQDWAGYGDAEHALWCRLVARQARKMPGRACDAFLDSVARLDLDAGIPDFERVTEALATATGWRLVAVPGLVPDEVFFRHLAHRRFPVTVWLRKPEEFDYIVEPDLFHDFFGHVPLLFDPVFADHMQAYGQGGLKAMGLGGLPFLSRLYWYTIEFGLVESPRGLRAYGAGLLSSGGELAYCLESRAPRRLPFDVERVMRTDYRIDAFQDTYFVLRDFRQLLDDTAQDFTPLYARLRQMSTIAPGVLLPGETDRAPA